MMPMRTTVTLDADVEILIKRAVREKGNSFKQVLNSAIRSGLSKPAGAARKPYKQPTHDLGPALVDLTKALSLATELEDQAGAHKLNAGR